MFIEKRLIRRRQTILLQYVSRPEQYIVFVFLIQLKYTIASETNIETKYLIQSEKLYSQNLGRRKTHEEDITVRPGEWLANSAESFAFDPAARG